jgi:hypothetical protein
MEPLAIFCTLLVLYCGYETCMDLIRSRRKAEMSPKGLGRRLGQAVLLRPNLASSRSLMSAAGGRSASLPRY